jgi:hypothetical protein
MSESSPAPAKSLVVPGVITVLGVALVARLWILGDAFWLDEIWSLSRVDEVESLLDIVTKESFQHDNNHPLITAWMSIIGDSDHWVLYRIPSLLSGMVAVLLVMDFAKGLRGVLFPGALIGLSFSMILYSTEARGYAMAVCFVLGAYRILARAEGNEFRLSVGGVIGYWSLCILAFLSHLIGVHFFAGMLAWTGIRLLRRVSIGEGALRMLWVHGVPGTFFVGLYFLFVRKLTLGGASNVPAAVTVQDVLAWGSGMPNELLFAVLGGAVVVGLAAWEVFVRGREGSYEWIVLPSVTLVAPLASMQASKVEGILNARFFLVGVAFLLLYAGRALARLHSRAGGAATFATIVLSVFAIGNVVREVRYVRGGGRGQYLEAVKFIAANSPQTVAIGSDNEFRNFGVLQYYKRFARPGQVLGFLPNASGHAHGPDWYLAHSVIYPEWGDPSVPPAIQLRSGAYHLVRSFSHFGPSGFTWYLYRRR